MSAGKTRFESERVVEEPSKGDSEIRVMKLESPPAHSVEPFAMPKIKRDGQGTYAATKARFGALAATDAERRARSQKDSRFSLSPLLRDPLAVETEERRVIDERVREGVASIAEDARKRASEIGYNEGFKKGYEEAYAKFQKQAADRLGLFEEFLRQCDRAKEEVYRANERFLIELVYRIARMVMLKELSTDKEYIGRLASALIEKIGIRENITVHVNPDDLATASMIQERIQKTIGDLRNLKIEASNNVRGGGCSVETQWNAIDASIETQLKGVYEALIGES